jgi:DNA-binding SARP family transcriptional activator
MSSFQLRLLGTVELYDEGRAIVVGPAKRRAVLAALALEPNQPVSLDQLAAAAWTGYPPRSAVANLRTHAASLRRILGGRLQAVPGGYRLRVKDGEVDVHEFLRLAHDGRAALGSGAARAAVHPLATALGLWHGTGAGRGLPGGTFLDAHFAGLDRQRLEAVEDLIEARLALAEHGEVLSVLREHLAHHPLRERAWGQLMLAEYRAGDAAAALAAYHHARDALRDQLGVDPGPDLTALQTAILNRDPALSGRAPEPGYAVPASNVRRLPGQPPGQPQPDAADLVRRAEELAAQLATFAAAMRAARLAEAAPAHL